MATSHASLIDGWTCRYVAGMSIVRDPDGRCSNTRTWESGCSSQSLHETTTVANRVQWRDRHGDESVLLLLDPMSSWAALGVILLLSVKRTTSQTRPMWKYIHSHLRLDIVARESERSVPRPRFLVYFPPSPRDTAGIESDDKKSHPHYRVVVFNPQVLLRFDTRSGWTREMMVG